MMHVQWTIRNDVVFQIELLHTAVVDRDTPSVLRCKMSKLDLCQSKDPLQHIRGKSTTFRHTSFQGVVGMILK